MGNENEKKKVVRRILCPVSGSYVLVKSECKGCRFWKGVKCTYRKSGKPKPGKKGYRSKRLKLGRRDRGRKDPRLWQKWQEIQNETDDIQLDPIGLEAMDRGFSGLPEEIIEDVSIPKASKTDPSRAEDEIAHSEDKLSEESQIRGELEILKLEPSRKWDGPPVFEPVGNPVSLNPVGEPVTGLPEPSPVKDPLSGLPSGLPDPDDPLGKV